MVSYAHRSRRIVLISASVGAGHDGAAAEISRRILERHAGFDVDRFDFINLMPPPVGPIGRATYRALIKMAPGGWEWMLSRLDNEGTDPSKSGATIARLAAMANRRLLRTIGPDVAGVISTYPLASQALGRLRAAGRLAVPVMTFLTDMSVHPLWVHPGVDVHFALHEIAAGQARELGAKDARVVRPAVRPEFNPRITEGERAAMRDALSEDFDAPVSPRLALVVAGSWGVGEIEQAVADIAETGLVTPIVACGHNNALRARIAKAGTGIPLGWVSDMPKLVKACDVVVQNAGGLTSLEAMAAGVPVLTYRCLAGHGRTNADALDRAGWVPWIRQRSDLAPALEQALTAGLTANPFTGTDVGEAVVAAVTNPMVTT